MTINGISGGGVSGMSGVSAISTGSTASSKAAMFDELLKKLKEEASKTPEQRARDGVLKKHDLTEDGYRQLPKDQKDAVDMEIKQAVERVAEQRRAGIHANDRAA